MRAIVVERRLEVRKLPLERENCFQRWKAKDKNPCVQAGLETMNSNSGARLLVRVVRAMIHPIATTHFYLGT
jgi:hypothetical protein